MRKELLHYKRSKKKASLADTTAKLTLEKEVKRSCLRENLSRQKKTTPPNPKTDTSLLVERGSNTT